jgi:hypothetical protein
MFMWRDQVLVLADEVYENIVHDENEHIRIATLPGMWERTLTLSSAGKTFSVTGNPPIRALTGVLALSALLPSQGWKIGWLIGHERLVQNVVIANQWVQFSVATPLQKAVADILEQARQPYQDFDSYFAWLTQEYKRKRSEDRRGARLRPVLTVLVLVLVSQGAAGGGSDVSGTDADHARGGLLHRGGHEQGHGAAEVPLRDHARRPRHEPRLGLLQVPPRTATIVISM